MNKTYVEETHLCVYVTCNLLLAYVNDPDSNTYIILV
jgi:hypothetical protein